MIHQPNMLLIGSADRNVGKTEMACAIIRSLARRGSVAALKVTTIRAKDGACPRGGRGCGVCTSLEGEHMLTDEARAPRGKDTFRMWEAGARPVLWLRVLRSSLERAAATTLSGLDATVPVVCESNSLRHTVEPGLFVMMRRAGSDTMKASAAEVWDLVDCVVSIDLDTDPVAPPDPSRFAFSNGAWSLR